MNADGQIIIDIYVSVVYTVGQLEVQKRHDTGSKNKAFYFTCTTAGNIDI